MTVWKGGRGVKAPYESTHVRVPLPVKDKVMSIIDAFKEGVDEPQLSEEEMIQIAKSILKQKKSAKISLETFLKAILKKEVSL